MNQKNACRSTTLPQFYVPAQGIDSAGRLSNELQADVAFAEFSRCSGMKSLRNFPGQEKAGCTLLIRPTRHRCCLDHGILGRQDKATAASRITAARWSIPGLFEQLRDNTTAKLRGVFFNHKIHGKN